MNKGIVLFATDDENIIRDVEEKISLSKTECNIIKDTSKIFIEHLFRIIEKGNSGDNNLDCEFEKGFFKTYYDNISAEVVELNVNDFLAALFSAITTYNKNIEIEKEITLPDNHKFKINKALVESFLKHIFLFCINSNDNYVIKINSGINYVVNKEIVNFIVNIADKTNEKSSLNSSISKLSSDSIEFINVFMNQLLEFYNGKFRINKIDAKLTIEMHLIKKVEK